MCILCLQLVIPRKTGKPVDLVEVEKYRDRVAKVVSKLESYFLSHTPFISSQLLTVADLFCACELMQLYAVHEHGLYECSAVVRDWMDRVKAETNPVFDEAHKVVYMVHDAYHDLQAKL